MRKVIPLLMALVFACALAAQVPSIGFSDLKAGASASVQGASVINGGLVTFCWGFGLRGSAQINPIARLQGAVEYVNWDAALGLQTLDFSAIMDFGNRLFFGLGLFGGPVLNVDAALGWTSFASGNFGWVVELGYRFKDPPDLTLGFDVHMALSDLMPEQINGSGFINQLPIRWGLWLGMDFWRQNPRAVSPAGRPS